MMLYVCLTIFVVHFVRLFKTSSDLTIRVGGKSIYVHKAILKIRSPHFRNMFKEYCKENDQRWVD